MVTVVPVRAIPAGTSRPSSPSRLGRKDFRPAPWTSSSCSGVRFSATGRSSMRMRVMETPLSVVWLSESLVFKLLWDIGLLLWLVLFFPSADGCRENDLFVFPRPLVSLLPSPASPAAGRGQLFRAER